MLDKPLLPNFSESCVPIYGYLITRESKGRLLEALSSGAAADSGTRNCELGTAGFW